MMSLTLTLQCLTQRMMSMTLTFQYLTQNMIIPLTRLIVTITLKKFAQIFKYLVYLLLV
jgi:hypothetical protein